MLSYVNKTLVLPAYMRWHNFDRLEWLKKAEKQQWDSREEILERQFRSLREMIKYAFEHVKYYKKLFNDHQINPENIKSPEDVKAIPILTKRDIQKNLHDLLSDACPASRRYQDASGGSTGQPTILYVDGMGLERKFAATLCSDKRTGWQVGEKVYYLWGADKEANRIHRLKERIVERFVYRKDTLNAFQLTEEKMADFARKMKFSNPQLIVAYTNAAYLFAQYLQENNIKGIQPKGIVCSAETLTDEKRNYIENTFQCKVLNRYGSREVGLIASECDHQEGLHINSDDIYLEIEPLKGCVSAEENSGEIIVTDLINQVMPLIRYNMGDMATLEKSLCSCGRGQPLIGNVTGRTSDFIIHPDGRLIHGELFSHAFYGIKEIRQFQIIQNKMDELDVNVVVLASLDESVKKHILDKISESVGNEVKVNLSIVDNIPTPPSGKFRFVISNIHSKHAL